MIRGGPCSTRATRLVPADDSLQGGSESLEVPKVLEQDIQEAVVVAHVVRQLKAA